MSFLTKRWKGAIEPKHDETAGTSFQSYRWKGAIEPAGDAGGGGATTQPRVKRGETIPGMKHYSPRIF